jgi:hypothetical protein
VLFYTFSLKYLLMRCFLTVIKDLQLKLLRVSFYKFRALDVNSEEKLLVIKQFAQFYKAQTSLINSKEILKFCNYFARPGLGYMCKISRLFLQISLNPRFDLNKSLM